MMLVCFGGFWRRIEVGAMIRGIVCCSLSGAFSLAPPELRRDYRWIPPLAKIFGGFRMITVFPPSGSWYILESRYVSQNYISDS